MHVTQWKEPALTWNGVVPDEGQASILEIRSDQFIPEFLEAMGGKNPADYFNSRRKDDDGPISQPMKLYQPLHGCYYLVTASLVCRQLGLPDKAVNRASGESVFYVIRRRAGSDEEAWIPTGSSGRWQQLSGDEVYTLAEDEERLPLHPVKICPQPETPQSLFTDNVERDLYYGYIPTGNRDKYKDTYQRSTATKQEKSAADVANEFIAAVEKEYQSQGYNFRKDLFKRRVYLPWKSRFNKQNGNFEIPVTYSGSAQEQQLYLLLELGIYLRDNLPTFWDALKAGSDSGLPAQMADLYTLLTDNLEVETGGGKEFLGDVLLQYEEDFDLVHGIGTVPATNFNLNVFTTAQSSKAETNLDTLNKAIVNPGRAIDGETQPIKVPDSADSEETELTRLIQEQVQPRPAANAEPVYQIRTVYEYDPDCPPVVSRKATRPFQLAKFFDPDAPARLVRLEAPSIKPKDLRKYARGVGIEMSPDLHKLVSCLSGSDMDDVIDSVESCESGGGGLSIEMVCTFSIQIIFLVAFIVMFIFLIALNFIFGWLAYLRICLPIPKKS